MADLRFVGDPYFGLWTADDQQKIIDTFRKTAKKYDLSDDMSLKVVLEAVWNEMSRGRIVEDNPWDRLEADSPTPTEI